MSITKEEKKEIKQEFEKHSQDTGSAEIQIATLSKRISNMTEHLKENKKDHGSKKGLYKMVAKRKKLLRYLKRTNFESYEGLVKKLNLRG